MKRFPVFVLFSLLLVACAASPEARATETSIAATSSASAWTATPTPTNTLIPTITPSPTNTATPTPTATPVGGKVGVVAFIGQKRPFVEGPQVYISDLSREEVIAVLPSTTDITQGVVKWSPDAQFLAFTSGDDVVSLNVLNMIDGTIIELRKGVGFIQNIAWSPDGKWIAYENGGSRGGGGTSLWTSNVGTQQFYPFGPGCDPEWSTDGTRLYFHIGGCHGDIFFYSDPTGNNKTELIFPKSRDLYRTINANFSWIKPSLDFLLAIRDRAVAVSPAELLTVSPDGKTGQIIFRFSEDRPLDQQHLGGFQISPNQEWLIVRSQDDRYQYPNNFFVYWLVHIPTGNVRDLSAVEAVQPIGWTADEQNVMLLTNIEDQFSIEMADSVTGDKVFSYKLPALFRRGHDRYNNTQYIDVGWSSSLVPENWADTTFRPVDPNKPPLDIARYDNFDEVVFDGTFNKELWQRYWGDANKAGFRQDGGFLEVLSNKSAALIATRHTDLVISSPSYYEARIKLSEITDGAITLILHGEFADGTSWDPKCGISGNKDSDEPWIFWTNSNRKDAANFSATLVDYDSWHTIRIEVNPNNSTVTFLMDGVVLGSVQEDELDKAKFSLVIENYVVKGSNHGYIDYVDFGELE